MFETLHKRRLVKDLALWRQGGGDGHCGQAAMSRNRAAGFR